MALHPPAAALQLYRPATQQRTLNGAPSPSSALSRSAFSSVTHRFAALTLHSSVWTTSQFSQHTTVPQAVTSHAAPCTRFPPRNLFPFLPGTVSKFVHLDPAAQRFRLPDISYTSPLPTPPPTAHVFPSSLFCCIGSGLGRVTVDV